MPHFQPPVEDTIPDGPPTELKYPSNTPFSHDGLASPDQFAMVRRPPETPCPFSVPSS